jgi:hypothetical protein
MTSPLDSEYKLTKLIKQGKVSINKDFILLAEWIKKEYGVKPINVVYDECAVDNRPRLHIIFELEEEEDLFWEPYGFEKVKQQQIANQFTAIQKQSGEGTYTRNRVNEYKTKNMWIAFSSFRKCAKIEIIWSISDSDIKALEEKLSMYDLWKIYPETFGTTFFYSEAQFKLLSENGAKEFIANEHFNLLKKYDEFDYFTLCDFPIIFESKETLESEYNGNLFNYSRR